MTLRLELLEESVALKHGAGGRAMRQLVKQVFADGFPPGPEGLVGLAAMDDGAAIPLGDGSFLVVTTDSHVVHPIVFPGGDIGRLAISGTVNDLAMMGATEPLALTSAIVVEDGFPLEALESIRRSMVSTCREAGVTVVTGDTKVMGRGELDGIAVDAGADGRERDGSEPVRRRELEAAPVARGEKRRLTCAAAAPARPRRMDHRTRREPTRRRHDRRPGRTPASLRANALTLRHDRGAARAMNRPVHPAPAE